MSEWFINRYEHYVYKAYDSLGCLLYVGITYDLPVRMRKHRRDSPWWAEHVYMEIEKHPDRKSAVGVERMSILNEYPIYNVQKIKIQGDF